LEWSLIAERPTGGTNVEVWNGTRKIHSEPGCAGLSWGLPVPPARALIYATARHTDAGPEVRPTIYSAMLKLFASDVAMQVTTDAVQVFGGSGYIRDAKITQIY